MLPLPDSEGDVAQPGGGDKAVCTLLYTFPNSYSFRKQEQSNLIHEMKFYPLALAALGTVAHAAVIQRCIGFETPLNGYATFLQVQNNVRDSSVLVYHISDLDETNIPMLVTDETLLMEENGFAMCTQKRLSQGLCDGRELGQFIFKQTNAAKDPITNVFVNPERQVTYDIPRGGIYCAVVYQDGVESVEGIRFVESHWYGFTSLAAWESLKMLLCLSVLLFISIAIINFMFRGETKGSIGTLLDDVRAMFTLQDLTVMLKALVFGFFMNGSDQDFRVLNPLTLVNQFYSVMSMVLFYKLSIGVFGITREKLHAINIEPKFKILLRSYAVASLILSFSPLLSNWSIMLPLIISCFLVVDLAWIPMVVIMWRNAKATEKEMLDPVFSRNYSLSRKCVIWIPFVLGLTSFLGQILVEFNSDFSNVMNSPYRSPRSSFAHSLEVSLSQNFWFVLLKHLTDFSMLIIQWAIIIIWRPHMLERTEDIHSNELSDAPHASLKLNEEDEETAV